MTTTPIHTILALACSLALQAAPAGAPQATSREKRPSDNEERFLGDMSILQSDARRPPPCADDLRA